MWFQKKPAAVAAQIATKGDAYSGMTGLFSTDDDGTSARERLSSRLHSLRTQQPRVAGIGAMDSTGGNDWFANFQLASSQPAPFSEAIASWFGSQTFIGHQLCALLMQHWLINKACSVPAEDAARNGYEVHTASGDPLAPDVLQLIKRLDRKRHIRKNLVQFVRLGKCFGVRVAFCKIKSTDPEFYTKPFNLDGITPGSYQGIVQVDPYWCMPELDAAAASQPDTVNFYEPTYWIINSTRYHRSHLIVYRDSEVPDILKPAYLYGGVPLPQRIMERVYAAERTANEAPHLAMSKRTTVFKTDLTTFFSNVKGALEKLAAWARFRDNMAVKMINADDSIETTDTSLADFDSVIMSQYQLVAAEAEMPATKLLGTTPKGFNASGEYEESVYHETLETVQASGMQPLLERHHEVQMRSDVVPAMQRRDAGFQALDTEVVWNPLDTPTAGEWADINLKRAQTGFQLRQTGAIDEYDERDRIRNDKNSDYNGIPEAERPADDAPGAPGKVDAEVMAAQQDPSATGADEVDFQRFTVDGCVLLTNQRYLSEETITQKMVAGDFEVQVTPAFVAAGGTYRVIIDGHHSLQAAIRMGAAPVLVEAVPDDSDYANVLLPREDGY